MFVACYCCYWLLPHRELNDDLLSVVCQSLTEEFTIPSEGGMVDYRMNLCLSFFYKFYLQVLSSLRTCSVPERECSGLRVSCISEELLSNCYRNYLVNQSKVVRDLNRSLMGLLVSH